MKERRGPLGLGSHLFIFKVQRQFIPRRITECNEQFLTYIEDVPWLWKSSFCWFSGAWIFLVANWVPTSQAGMLHLTPGTRHLRVARCRGVQVTGPNLYPKSLVTPTCTLLLGEPHSLWVSRAYSACFCMNRSRSLCLVDI